MEHANTTFFFFFEKIFFYLNGSKKNKWLKILKIIFALKLYNLRLICSNFGDLKTVRTYQEIWIISYGG